MSSASDPRVVLVHDWLTGMRGGEKCLEVLCRRWPDARLYTLLHKKGTTSPAIEALRPRTSILRYLPGAHRYYRYLLPIMPLAADWRIPACDLVVSFSHCVAKAARAPEGVPHVCYCFTPMRYAWHMRSAYFGDKPRTTWKGWLLDGVLRLLRDWDRRTSDRVTHFVAISRTVAQRIQDCYGRDSTVIYPPVDTDYYTPAAARREDFYLVLSALAPYKRIELAIAASNRLRRRLAVIGSGQNDKKLRALAGPTIHFLGWQPDEVVRGHLRRCKALLFPGEEDFGIVPVEAMACGTPVIAYGRGGATETVIPLGRTLAVPPAQREPTGLWFDEQSPDCLADAMETFEQRERDFNPAALRRQALRFNQRRFAGEIFAYLAGVLEQPRTAAARRAA
jgi:glycosyltransferase involved in cell wall biosynthesis